MHLRVKYFYRSVVRAKKPYGSSLRRPLVQKQPCSSLSKRSMGQRYCTIKTPFISKQRANYLQKVTLFISCALCSVTLPPTPVA